MRANGWFSAATFVPAVVIELEHDAVVKFHEFSPGIPSFSYMFMLEAMTYKVSLLFNSADSINPDSIEVEAWTSQYDKDHNDGTWHGVLLPYRDTSPAPGLPGRIIHSYSMSAIITSDCDFKFTYRIRWRRSPAGADSSATDDWVWSHPYQVDGFVHVEPPRLHDRWTLGPDFDHILGSVHLGNFIAATNALECGFTHVLNVADNLDMVYQDRAVKYKKIAMKDGAHNPIEREKILAAVDWLRQNNRSGNMILVNCRAGIGRAGSVAVAFVYAENPAMSFDDAKEFVGSRRFIYPHFGLKEDLEYLFPR